MGRPKKSQNQEQPKQGAKDTTSIELSAECLQNIGHAVAAIVTSALLEEIRKREEEQNKTKDITDKELPKKNKSVRVRG